MSPVQYEAKLAQIASGEYIARWPMSVHKISATSGPAVTIGMSSFYPMSLLEARYPFELLGVKQAVDGEDVAAEVNVDAIKSQKRGMEQGYAA